MENKMNIAELLKDCPKGMELDCAVFKGLEFDRIDENNGTYPIICRVKTEFGSYNIHTFNKYGCYSTAVYSKCIIFPKGKTTWEGFVPPCRFKDGDIISNGDYVAIFYKIGTPCNCISPNVVYYHCYYSQKWRKFKKELDFGIGISTEFKYATEEEKEKLFKAIKNSGYCWNTETKTLEELIKEETMEEKLEQITLDIPKGYEFFGINDDNQVVLAKKQLQYPKTYDECCKVISVPIRNSIGGHKWKILQEFQKLIVCRDAYWKIAGEQMGLGKPWEPDWKNYDVRKYCIATDKNIVGKYNRTTGNKVLAFPTEEMRDAFYENFKELINETKELL